MMLYKNNTSPLTAIMKAIFGEVPGVVSISDGYSSFAGLILEILGTLFLVLTVLSTTNSSRGHPAGYLQPLSIGIAIFVAHLFLVSSTSKCFVYFSNQLTGSLQ